MSEHPSPRPVTDEEVATFERDGVVCLRGFLTEDRALSLVPAIEELAANIGQTSTGYDLENLGDAAYSDAEQFNYGHAKQYDLETFAGWLRFEGDERAVEAEVEGAPKGAFLTDTGCWHRSSAIRALALDEAVAAAAARLMRSATVGYYDDQMFVKRPGTRQKTEWHQDYPTFHIEGWQGCVFWLPVDGATEETGAMRYVRGSHRWDTQFGAGMFVSRTLMPGSQGEKVPDIDADPGAYDVVSFDLEPGDVVVHHFRTLHTAGGNRSATRQRRAMSLRYVGDDMRFKLRPGAPFPPHHTHKLQDGDRLWCDDFPLVLEGGQLAA